MVGEQRRAVQRRRGVQRGEPLEGGRVGTDSRPEREWGGGHAVIVRNGTVHVQWQFVNATCKFS